MRRPPATFMGLWDHHECKLYLPRYYGPVPWVITNLFNLEISTGNKTQGIISKAHWSELTFPSHNFDKQIKTFNQLSFQRKVVITEWGVDFTSEWACWLYRQPSCPEKQTIFGLGPVFTAKSRPTRPRPVIPAATLGSREWRRTLCAWPTTTELLSKTKRFWKYYYFS